MRTEHFVPSTNSSDGKNLVIDIRTVAVLSLILPQFLIVIDNVKILQVMQIQVTKMILVTVLHKIMKHFLNDQFFDYGPHLFHYEDIKVQQSMKQNYDI